MNASQKNNKKWIFFDVGYTLVNEDDVWKTRIKEQVELPMISGFKKMGTIEFENKLKDAFMKNVKYKILVKELGFAEIVRFPYEKENLYKDTINTLESLQIKYDLGIIANQDKGLNERLDKLGILKFFTIVLGSDDIGIAKPDKRIFEMALELANCKPSNAYMVGDRLDNDIAPAKEIGFKTIRILNGYRIEQVLNGKYQVPDFTINTISELLNIDL